MAGGVCGERGADELGAVTHQEAIFAVWRDAATVDLTKRASAPPRAHGGPHSVSIESGRMDFLINFARWRLNLNQSCVLG
jgi:hypothetical protein